MKRILHKLNGSTGGALNSLGEEFVASLYASYERHGRAAIERVREGDPVAFIRIIVSVLPKEVKLNHSPPDELTADEIDQRIRAFQALIDELHRTGYGHFPRTCIAALFCFRSVSSVSCVSRAKGSTKAA